MEFRSMFHDRIKGKEILIYTNKYISKKYTKLSINDKNDLAQETLFKLLKSNPVVKVWKTYIQKTIISVFNDKHKKEIPATDLGYDENGRNKFDIMIDKNSCEIFESYNKFSNDKPLTLSQHLDKLFADICCNFKALNENPADVGQGDLKTVLPIVDMITICKSKPRCPEKWLEVWNICRIESPKPSNKEIAVRVGGISKDTVGKAIKCWEKNANDFQQKWLSEWLEYNDEEKYKWCRNTIKRYIKNLQKEISDEQHEKDRKKYHRLCGFK